MVARNNQVRDVLTVAFRLRGEGQGTEVRDNQVPTGVKELLIEPAGTPNTGDEKTAVKKNYI